MKLVKVNTKLKIISKIKGFNPFRASFAIGIAIFAFVAFILITFHFYHSEIIDFSYFGQTTGNYAQLIAGVIGSLLSFAGIILIYVTFKEQRESNQAQEIKLNQQTDLFNQQQFETTFFNLIENHFRIIRSFDAEFRGYLKNEKTEKSGHIQIDEHFRIFKYNFELISNYKIGSGYSNYQTINFYPLTNEHFEEPILKKSASNIQLIIDYITASKQIKESEKEIYGRILFTSLNESEVYFYVARSFWEKGLETFVFSDFTKYFEGQEMFKAVKFTLHQTLGFFPLNSDEPLNQIVLTRSEIEADLLKMGKDDIQETNLLHHIVRGKGITFQDGSIILISPFRKEFEIDFNSYLSEGGGLYYFSVPIASLLNEIYERAFNRDDNGEQQDSYLKYKLAFSYTIKSETDFMKIFYTIKTTFEPRDEFRLEIE